MNDHLLLKLTSDDREESNAAYRKLFDSLTTTNDGFHSKVIAREIDNIGDISSWIMSFFAATARFEEKEEAKLKEWLESGQIFVDQEGDLHMPLDVYSDEEGDIASVRRIVDAAVRRILSKRADEAKGTLLRLISGYHRDSAWDALSVLAGTSSLESAEWDTLVGIYMGWVAKGSFAANHAHQIASLAKDSTWFLKWVEFFQVLENEKQKQALLMIADSLKSKGHAIAQWLCHLIKPHLLKGETLSCAIAALSSCLRDQEVTACDKREIAPFLIAYTEAPEFFIRANSCTALAYLDAPEPDITRALLRRRGDNEGYDFTPHEYAREAILATKERTALARRLDSGCKKWLRS